MMCYHRWERWLQLTSVRRVDITVDLHNFAIQDMARGQMSKFPSGLGMLFQCFSLFACIDFCSFGRENTHTVTYIGMGQSPHWFFFFATRERNASTIDSKHRNIHRKVVYKSHGLCAIFNFLVRLLFEGGLHAMFWIWKIRESSLARCNMDSESATWLRECHKILSKCKQTFWHAKSGSIWHYMDDVGLSFSSCDFYLSAAYVQLQFGYSAASMWVVLLYTTLR